MQWAKTLVCFLMISAELNFLILLHQRSKLEQKTPRAIMVLENTHDSLAK